MGYILNAFPPNTSWPEAQAILSRVDFQRLSEQQDLILTSLEAQ